MNDKKAPRGAAAGDDAEAPQNTEIRDAMLGRRGFLLKSASVASSIAAPTLIGAGALAISNPVKAGILVKNSIFRSSDIGFYNETRIAGLPDWDAIEGQWTESIVETTEGFSKVKTEGMLTFYKSRWFPFPPYITATYSFELITVKHSYSGLTDIDTSENQKITYIPPDGIWGVSKTEYRDTSPKYSQDELRRRLQQRIDWDENWRIPISWLPEIAFWARFGNTVGNQAIPGVVSPYIGVLVHQWGSPTTGVAIRIIYVYTYEYRFLSDGTIDREATLRRTMHLIGGYVNGIGWRNIAIDEITDGMLPELRDIAAVLFAGYRAGNRNVEDWPGFPNEAYEGWREQIALQNNANRGALAAILAQMPGGLGAEAVYGFYVALRRGGRAMDDLRRRYVPAANGFYDRDLPRNYNGPRPPRMRGIQENISNLEDLFNINVVDDWDEVHGQINWLQARPPVGWVDFHRDTPMNLDLNPQLQAENRFPAVIPGNIPNNTANATHNQADVTAAFDAEVRPGADHGSDLFNLLNIFND